MYCTSCGTENTSAAPFCGRCGQSTNAPGSIAGPTASRLHGHIRLLGILWIALSAIHLIPGLVLALLFSAGTVVLPWILPPAAIPWAFAWIPLLVGIGALILACSIGGIAAGWGLLQRKPWARTLAIILGIIGLPSPPFGTALGIYTLWVLLPAESEREYDAEAGAQSRSPLPAI
jgi:hypothetical protein